MLLNKLGAVVLNNILHDFAKSSCVECTHQESQIYCSSQKLAALHFINKIITVQAGEKEETSKSFLLYLFGRGHKFLKKFNSKILVKLDGSLPANPVNNRRIANAVTLKSTFCQP